mgnify:CR=1 FL=1
MLPLSILFDQDGGIRIQASLLKPGGNCAAPVIQSMRLDSAMEESELIPVPITRITYYHIGAAGMYELYEED